MIAEQQIAICEAIIEILKIFADSEIGGQYEIDYKALCDYLNSAKCMVNYFNCGSKEEIYEHFTNECIDGLPVWRFLKLPEWTLNMVEKSFKAECEELHKEMQKKYKCYTCKYFKVRNTELGVLAECKYKEDEPKRMSDRPLRLARQQGPFEPKKSCKNYVSIKTVE